MLWYLFKTWPGREEELVKETRRTVPPAMYEEVFIIRAERIWRRQGRCIVHLEPLFKGCVFMTCREAAGTAPVFRQLERVPYVARMMAAGHLSVFPLMEKDAEFLREIAGEGHVIKASYMLKEISGKYRIIGPLEKCIDNIEFVEFRKRYVKLRGRLWGEDVRFTISVVLNEDLRENYLSKESENLPDHYTLIERYRDLEGRKTFIASNYGAMSEGKEIQAIG